MTGWLPRLLLMLTLPIVAGSALAQIPNIPVRQRLLLEREAVRNFGLNPPISILAAQIHQESGWRADAASPFAQGLAQFTPSTAKWLPEVCPSVGAPDPWDPEWSLRAQSCYDAWLYRRVARHQGTALLTCSRWAFTLRAYNGGEGWIKRERALAASKGANPNDWKAVEPFRLRAGWAHKENIGYPIRILTVLEPRYRKAGWSSGARCQP